MSTPENLVDILSTTKFQELLSNDLKRISLIYFWTSWAAPCVEMNPVVEGLANAYPKLLTLRASNTGPYPTPEADNISSGGGRRTSRHIRFI
jgi:thiol-disulfide isomerase/thioredoxin